MGWVSQAVEKVSDTVAHVSQTIAESPIAQAAISIGAAIATGGASIPYTAAALGVNQASQNGDFGAGLLAAGGSYLAGTGAANYAATGSLFGNAAGAAGAAGATAAEQTAA